MASTLKQTRRPCRTRPLDCAQCGSRFFASHSQAKYCSPECARVAERASWRAYGERNRAKRRRYHQELYRRDPEAVAQRVKAYRETEAGKEMAKRSGERQRQKHPDKYSARQAVLMAVRSGRLKKESCAACGETKVHAHHDDYSRPLDVRWLCEAHHRELHPRGDAKAAASIQTRNTHA
jgi:ribosomal protein S27AE